MLIASALLTQEPTGQVAMISPALPSGNFRSPAELNVPVLLVVCPVGTHPAPAMDQGTGRSCAEAGTTAEEPIASTASNPCLCFMAPFLPTGKEADRPAQRSRRRPGECLT